MLDIAFPMYSVNAVFPELKTTSDSIMFGTSRATWTPKDLPNHGDTQMLLLLSHPVQSNFVSSRDQVQHLLQAP